MRAASSDRTTKTAIRKATFRSFFDQWFRPEFLFQAKSGTMASYTEAIGHWERWHEEGRGEEPALAAIDKRMLEEFRDWLAGRPGRKAAQLSRRTVNKTLTALVTILRYAAEGKEALDRVPRPRPFTLPRRLPKRVDLAALARVYQTAEYATCPIIHGVAPAAWWRAWIVVALTTGLRRGAMLSLRWDHVDLAGRSVRIEAEDDKEGCERIKGLCPEAIRHLVVIRQARDPRVFARSCSWPALWRQWLRLQRIAGVPHLTIHDLKRACAQLFAPRVSAHVLQEILDHADVTTAQWYVSQAHEARAAMERVELPAGFTPGFGLVG